MCYDSLCQLYKQKLFQMQIWHKRHVLCRVFYDVTRFDLAQMCVYQYTLLHTIKLEAEV